MAGDKTPLEPKIIISAATRPRLSRVASVNGASKLSNEISNGNGTQSASGDPQSARDKIQIDEDIFRNMSSLEMMDVLSRDIVHWQQQHGKWGDKHVV